MEINSEEITFSTLPRTQMQIRQVRFTFTILSMKIGFQLISIAQFRQIIGFIQQQSHAALPIKSNRHMLPFPFPFLIQTNDVG